MCRNYLVRQGEVALVNRKRVARVLISGEEIIRHYYFHFATYVYYTLYILLYIAFGSAFLYWGWGKDIMRFGINMSQVVRVIGYIIIGLSLCVYIRNLMVFYTMQRALTNKRLVKCVGILSTSEFETNLADMQTINVHQSVVGRIFNYGDLSYTMKHQEDREMPFMPDPYLLKRQIVEARNALLAGRGYVPSESEEGREHTASGLVKEEVI